MAVRPGGRDDLLQQSADGRDQAIQPARRRQRSAPAYPDGPPGGRTLPGGIELAARRISLSLARDFPGQDGGSDRQRAPGGVIRRSGITRAYHPEPPDELGRFSSREPRPARPR